MSTPLLPLLRAYAAERLQALTEHPTPDELLDYHLGDSTPEQREQIQDHLALCPACTRAVLDFAAFPDVAPAAEGERGPDTAAAWARLRERTFAAGAPVVRHPRASRRRRVGTTSLIAASLLVASLVGYQAGKAGSPRSSEVFTALVEGHTERSFGPGEVEEIQAPAWADRFTLTLLLEEPQEFSRYDLELIHLGRPVWSRTGLRGDSKSQVSFDVPRDLPSGIYIVHLYGVGKGGARALVLQERIDIEWEGRRD